MKTIYITTMMAVSMIMLLLPLCAKQNILGLQASTSPDQQIVQNTTEQEDVVKVKLSSNNEIISISMEDYLFGVVAAEMPALYENEALKAQAVAAYTYFLIQKEGNADKDYDITDDYRIDQAFVTVADAKEKWGQEAAKYENKIRSAVKTVKNKKVTYNGQPACTVYHAISFGVTENATDVWGGDYPYLISVDSNWDKLQENYLSTAEFSSVELKEKLSDLVSISDTKTNVIKDIKRTKAGGVKTLQISEKSIQGSDLRSALNLRSANFEVEFKDGKYIFTTKGYGHAIGMSQYGAHYMAMQGETYDKILLHYYSGCKIE